MTIIEVAQPQILQTATAYLSEQDSVLAPIIGRAGACILVPHTNYYQELVQSILGQQLSLQSAAAIERRFVALFGGEFPTPVQLAARDIDELRSAGLSRAKASYVQDLAGHVLDGRISFNAIDNLDNEAIVRELTVVKGIGEWTAHMFLIFCMGRLDVLPTGDLGIKNGIRKLYDLPLLPTPHDVANVAAAHHWHPYESVASWYIWQSIDLPS
jgi:DNA-3-methyladenine glycosylase II